MFSEEIDVASIMRDIKEEVLKEGSQELDFSEISGRTYFENIHSQMSEYNQASERIAKYLANTHAETVSRLNIGFTLPQFGKFGRFIGFFARQFARIIRKSISFVIQDQRDVNIKQAEMARALLELSDVLDMKIKLINLRIDDLEKMIKQINEGMEKKEEEKGL